MITMLVYADCVNKQIFANKFAKASYNKII